MSPPTQGSATRWWWIRHAPVPGAEGRLNGQRDIDCDTSDAAAFVTGSVWGVDGGSIRSII